jgi:uncharacterized protein (TIGR03118 family)
MRTNHKRKVSGIAFVEPLEARQLLSGTPLFSTTNLVSDGAVPAAHVDPNLLNPWGVAFAPGAEFWISDNNSGKSTLYDGTGTALSLVVNVPDPGAAGTPTGQVFNGTNGFNVTENGVTGPAEFIYDTEGGTISGWSPTVDQTNAIIAVNNSQTSVYKGLAIATTSTGATQLFAANFRTRAIDVFDSNFSPVAEAKGAFSDTTIPKTYAPFNVQNINGNLFVTYAKQDAAKHDDVGGAGHGFVDEFNTSGKLLRRLQRGAFLDSPWGVAVAPASFGSYAGDILVGNFKSGFVDVFNTRSGRFVGNLVDTSKKKIHIDHLWALTPGSGGSTESANTIFFTAGINDEADGLFGSIQLAGVAKAPPPPVVSGGFY